MQTTWVHRRSARNRCPVLRRSGRSFVGGAIAALLPAALVAGALMLGCERGTAGETITLVLTGTGSANDWPLMIALSKGFFQDGDVKLQIQADLFNILNETNLRFSNQSLNFSGGGFGLLNTAAPPRNVQLGMRVTF